MQVGRNGCDLSNVEARRSRAGQVGKKQYPIF